MSIKTFNEEYEFAVLKSCMDNSNNLISALCKGLSEEDFYNSENKRLFKCIVDTHKAKGTTDMMIVSNELSKYGLTETIIFKIVEYALYVGNIDPYLKELFELRINRECTRLALEIQSNKLVGVELIGRRLEDIEKLKLRGEIGNTVITLDKIKPIDIYKAEKISTGFMEIDKKILGFLFGSLVVITGYNGNGKSTLINQMCISESISQGYKVFAFSPELTNSNLKQWLYPTIANADHFINASFGNHKYKTVSKKGVLCIDKYLSDKLFIYSDNITSYSEEQLFLTMESLAGEGVRVFVIDNLMKVELSDSYKNELLAQKQFVNRLKAFAKKHNSIVHLVAHPRKPYDGDKISKFDISGSGDITNIADYVMSISRVADEVRKEEPTRKDAYIKVMKDRPRGNGEFAIDVYFDRDRRRYYTYQKELNKDYGYINGMVEVDSQIKF